MRQKATRRKLKLDRETLLRLEDENLRDVLGGAPTKGAICGLTDPSACATCLCTV